MRLSVALWARIVAFGDKFQHLDDATLPSYFDRCWGSDQIEITQDGRGD